MQLTVPKKYHADAYVQHEHAALYGSVSTVLILISDTQTVLYFSLTEVACMCISRLKLETEGIDGPQEQ